MPDDNKTVEAAQVDAEQPSGRIWTNEEHDAYVKARIDKQAAKFAEKTAAYDSRIAELEAANKAAADKLAEYEARISRAEMVASVSKETGLPENVVANLKGDDAEALKAAAEAVKASVQLYPTAPAGAAAGPVRVPSMTRAEIMNIRDPKKRLAAIEANIDSFK